MKNEKVEIKDSNVIFQEGDGSHQQTLQTTDSGDELRGVLAQLRQLLKQDKPEHALALQALHYAENGDPRAPQMLEMVKESSGIGANIATMIGTALALLTGSGG